MSDDRIKTLSIKDRLVLANQFQVLANQCVKSKEDGWTEYYLKMVEICKRGYELEYYQLDECFVHQPMSCDACEEVRNTLMMFEVLQRSNRKLGNPIEPEKVVFKGFSVNGETNYVGYTEFLIATEEKWTDVILGGDTQGQFQLRLNSHHPMREVYCRMMSRFKKVWEKKLEAGEYVLTVEEIQGVLDARFLSDKER